MSKDLKIEDIPPEKQRGVLNTLKWIDKKQGHLPPNESENCLQVKVNEDIKLVAHLNKLEVLDFKDDTISSFKIRNKEINTELRKKVVNELEDLGYCKDKNSLKKEIQSALLKLQKSYPQYCKEILTEIKKGGETELQLEPPEEEVSVELLKGIINKNFPNMWEVVEDTTSVINTLSLKDQSNPLGVNLEGAPSSEKTTILSFYYDIPSLTFKTDNFTPKSFVSHSANVPEEELAKIDLLPKIKNKCMIVSEFAPILGKRKEDLIENLSIMTRVLDGEGYESDSGVRGHRGYKGEYVFEWLSASTPLPNHVWKVMGNLGTRLLSRKIPSKNKNTTELKKQLEDTVTYKDKVKECRHYMHNFLKGIFLKNGGIRQVVWNKEKDNTDAYDFIVNCALLVRLLRAPIEIWTEKTQGDEPVYSYQTPVIEEPERLINLLYDLARGRALMYSRNYLILEDVLPVFRVALSSMPYDRYLLFKIIYETSNLNTRVIAEKLNCSERNALRIIEIMRVLGICNLTSINTEKDGKEGRPLKEIVLTNGVEKLVGSIKDIIKKIDTHTVKSMSEIIEDVAKTTLTQRQNDVENEESGVLDTKATGYATIKKIESESTLIFVDVKPPKPDKCIVCRETKPIHETMNGDPICPNCKKRVLEGDC